MVLVQHRFIAKKQCFSGVGCKTDPALHEDNSSLCTEQRPVYVTMTQAYSQSRYHVN